MQAIVVQIARFEAAGPLEVQGVASRAFEATHLGFREIVRQI